MRFRKEHLLLYAVTDRVHAVKGPLYSQVEKALEGGVTCVQLREKYLNEDEYVNEAVKIKELCHKYDVPIIINDNLAVALKSGADGIHVGQEDMDAGKIREITGSSFIIGVTAKTVRQALRAQADGADYIGSGAVFPSPTKQGAVRISKEKLREICGSVEIPAVAIGGINRSNMAQLEGCGMSGFAVVSAVFGADDITAEAVLLKAEAESVLMKNRGGYDESSVDDSRK